MTDRAHRGAEPEGNGIETDDQNVRQRYNETTAQRKKGRQAVEIQNSQ